MFGINKNKGGEAGTRITDKDLMIFLKNK